MHNRTSGWQLGALSTFTVVSVVFLINVIFLIWSVVATYGHHNGVGYLSEGKCNTIRAMSVGLHILINILATCLLSGSNYCMALPCIHSDFRSS
jgi:hypothetical protein